jgi:hypothetical protein
VSPLSFCYFDSDGPVDVEVKMLDGLRKAGVDRSSVVVRPLAQGIKPEIKDHVARFRLPGGPCQISFEPGGGILHPLHIFVNPPERDIPDPKDPNVLYYGPGYHEANEVDIKDGQTIYIAGGAIVSLKPQPTGTKMETCSLYGLELYWAPGLFAPKWKKHVTVRGRGILCGRKSLEARQRGALLVFEGCEDVSVEGIIIRESAVWSLNLSNCKRARISNVKIVGHYVNNDGIAIGGTSDAVVEDCFCHNADDALEVKVWIPQRNVVFRNCIVWDDVGQSLGLACETNADIENVAFENCTVIHSPDDMASRGVIGLHVVGTGSVRGFRFENITIEDVRGPHHPSIKVFNNWDDWHMGHPAKPGSPYELAEPPVREKPNGSIRDVIFRNVRVLHCANSDVVLMGDGAGSEVEDVRFDGVEINGERLKTGDARIKTNAWVRDVEVR